MSATAQTTAAQVNQVVDNLADKLDIAAKEVQPLAEQVIREYQFRSLVGLAACVIVMIAVGFFGCMLVRACLKEQKHYEKELAQGDPTAHSGDWGFGGAIVSVITMAVCVGAFVHGVGFAMEAVAPTYYCLQALLK